MFYRPADLQIFLIINVSTPCCILTLRGTEEAVGVPKDVYGCAVVGGMVF